MRQHNTARHERAASGPGQDLLFRAITGVVQRVEAGELPVFARFLCLPRREWQKLQEYCFPEEMLNEWAAEPKQAVPGTFTDLVALMMANRTTGTEPEHALWLAHAIAAASHGERHLWQDLGVAGRDEVSSLLATYFYPLAARNTQDQKWKRFLFAQLGAMLGDPELRPPGCGKCDHLQICFPTSAPGANMVSSTSRQN